MNAVGAGLAPALLLALFCAGCALHHPKTPATAKNDLDISIVCLTHPTYPVQMDGTRFFVIVKDKSGQPLTLAHVTMQLTMPAMDMGRNEVALHEATDPPGIYSPGTYTGTGRFTMPGDWQAQIQIDKNGQHFEKTVMMKVQ